MLNIILFSLSHYFENISMQCPHSNQYPIIEFFILVPEITAKIMPVVYDKRCCLSKSHAHVIKRKLQLYAVKRQKLLQKFQHAKSEIAIKFAL